MKALVLTTALLLLVTVCGCGGVSFSWDQYSPGLAADSSVNSWQFTPDGYRTNR